MDKFKIYSTYNLLKIIYIVKNVVKTIFYMLNYNLSKINLKLFYKTFKNKLYL